jgi:hypothetical protein
VEQVVRLLHRHHGFAVTVAVVKERNEETFSAQRAAVLKEADEVVEWNDLLESSSSSSSKFSFSTVLVLPVWHDSPDAQSALLHNVCTASSLPVQRSALILQELLPRLTSKARVGCFAHALGSLEDVGSAAHLPGRMMAAATAMTIRCLAQGTESLLMGICPGGPYMPGIFEEHWKSSLRLVQDTKDAVAERLVSLLLQSDLSAEECRGRVLGRSGQCVEF